MNKYLKRGIGGTVLGIVLCAFGMHLKELESNWYGFTLIIGVIVFGIGFVTIVYSLIRKIERKSILESREKQSEDRG